MENKNEKEYICIVVEKGRESDGEKMMESGEMRTGCPCRIESHSM